MFHPVMSVFVMSLFCLAMLSGCSQSERVMDARYRELPFDETHWKAVREMPWTERISAENRRAKMVGDLVENHLRPGMTKEDIERLLGAPDPSGDFFVCDSSVNRQRKHIFGSYTLSISGFEDIQGWSQGHRFVIEFDREGNLIRHRIVLD